MLLGQRLNPGLPSHVSPLVIMNDIIMKVVCSRIFTLFEEMLCFCGSVDSVICREVVEVPSLSQSVSQQHL